MAIKIIDIDLSETIQSYNLGQEYSDAQVIVRWKQKPVGISTIRNLKEGVIHKERIYSDSLSGFKTQLIAEIISEKINPGKKYPPISVAICTRDRAHFLRRCLDSLRHLDYQNFEILVVDNCSIDSSVYEAATEYNVKYFREDNPGLNYARNRGIKESLYNIVAFIDDDAIADPIWLKGIAEGFSDSEVSLVTGLVLPAELNTRAQVEFENYGGMSKGFFPFCINKKDIQKKQMYWAPSWGVGANMAFRKDIFSQIGYFDESLDVGTPTCGGGDIEYFFRAVYHGFVLRYEPEAVIKHYHREKYTQLKQQIFNNGKSFPAFILTTLKYAGDQYSYAIWFLLYHWLFKQFIVRTVKAILQLNKNELKFIFWEFSGAINSIPAFLKSKKIHKKIYSNKIIIK